MELNWRTVTLSGLLLATLVVLTLKHVITGDMGWPVIFGIAGLLIPATKLGAKP